MFSRWPIRYKLQVGIAMLLVIVATLAFSGFRGVYAYRGLARSVSRRAAELPLATALAQDVSDLRVTVSHIRRLRDFAPSMSTSPFDAEILRGQFQTNYQAVEQTLGRYHDQLNSVEPSDQQIGDNRRERETVRKIERSLALIDPLNCDEDCLLDEVKV